MKKSLLVLLCLISSAVFADTSDVERFLYNGLDNTVEMNLSTEKTRTEYRDVRVPSTCYRTEYRRVCRQQQPTCRVVCDRNNRCRRVCRGGGRVCRNEPVQVRYTCMRWERRAYQVHDYDVETNVRFVFNNDQASNDVREEFTMRVTGENASLSVQGSKNYFLMLENRSRNENRQGGVKYVDLVYKVKLVPAHQANSVLRNGIQNVKLRRGVLTFTLGAGFNLNDFSQQIRIFKNRRLGSDTLLLDRLLSDAEMNTNSTMNATNITIDLKSLGINLPSKMRVILDTKFGIDENRVLNRGEIKTSANSNWVFR